MSDAHRWLERVDVHPDAAPPELAALLGGLVGLVPGALSRNDRPAVDVAERQAAVLILLATDGPDGPDVLLQQRAASMREHAGEVAFPGGGREHDDDGPVATALREAVEETGLDPTGVDALAVLPRLHIPPSRFDVTAVLAHWRTPSPVKAVDARESTSVLRVPLRRLADPAHRVTGRGPSGWEGPAFALPDAVVWGFTGEVLSGILRLGGWERPWDDRVAIDLAEV